MKKIILYIDNALALFAFVATAGYIGSVLIQIFSRSFLPSTPPWTEELSRYFFIYAVAFAAGRAVRANAYVAVDIFVSHIPQRLRKSYYLLLNIFLMLFSLYFAVRSVPKFVFLKARLVSPAMEIPMPYIYFSMLILFGMLTISYLFETILLVKDDKISEGGVSLT